MEKKNIQERIDEIYNGNSKIPFMQSKDILQLGYQYGIDDSINKFIDVTSNHVKDNIIKKENINKGGKTSKEMIEYGKSKINENKNTIAIDKKELKEKYEKELKYKILESQIKLSGDLINYMNTNHNIVDVYDYLKSLNRKFQDDLYREQVNHGEYKRIL